MNKEKINKIYCPIMFGYGLILIFLAQMNVLIHFQWAVSIWADVFAFIAVTALAGIACFDMTFKVKRRNISVAIVSVAVAFLCLIAAIGNIVQIVKEDCGVFALVMNLITLAASLFYAYLHFKVDDAISVASKKKKRLSRGFAIGGAVFVLVCCIITPSLVVLGQRVGYPFDGCVEEQRCPVSYALPFASKKGSLETIEYDINYYTVNGEKTENKIHKRAKVYLPYGYHDEANKDKRYDILYLSHGATYDENHFFGSGISKYKSFFDHMIQDGKIKPMIVVTPCLYTKNKSLDDAKDSNLTIRFQYELRNDLVPLIEKKYRTFAANTTSEALIESRIHRAFAGYSMGSATTLSVFEYNLDYFSKFVPMSVGFGSAERLIDALKNRFENNYGKDDFKIGLSTGGRDFAYTGMVNQYKDMLTETEYFVKDNTLKEGNFALYVGTNHRHGSEFVMEYLYVYLPMMFGI